MSINNQRINLAKERISTIFKRSPTEALEYLLTQAETSQSSYPKDAVFMWTSALGIDKETRYGSYKHITRKDLEGRKYDINFYDYQIGVFFTDVLFNPKTNQHIPKD